MMVTSSRSVVGPLTSSATSPGAHAVHLAAADLSPRSSNSSMVSSNESLLNTSLSVPSPGTRESGNSPRRETVEISALQCLQNAFKRSPFYLQENDNEHLEQHFSQGYPILNSPVVNALFSSPHMKSESDESLEDEMPNEENELSNGHHNGHARAESPSSTSPTSIDNYNNSIANIFQCPLCAVVFNSRHDFNEHLVTHSAQHACPKCIFITSTEEELRAHVQEMHGVDDFMDILSDDEVKTPKTNAQGRLKTFKCKHCEHRAVTKKEFWDHTKSHIREEKMLHCPKCPFITEYKHHLEYHLRNHMGSKPYQCTKCAYSCVNKSMLNSHLKSHSTVYQYRCSDCSYATKYCHSLKLHLRKYNHNPAMVLNPDGTPNPLPIIDVYGTRRGPKMKRPDPILEGLATTQPLKHPNSAGNNSIVSNKAQKMQKKTKKAKVHHPRQHQPGTKDVSSKPASSPQFISSMPSQSATPPLRKMNKEDSSGDSDSEMRTADTFHLQKGNGKGPLLPQAPISPDSIAMILQRTNNVFMDPQKRKEMSAFAQPNAHDMFSAINQYLPLFNPMFQMSAGTNISDQQTSILAHFLQTRLSPAQQQLQNLLKTNEIRGCTTPLITPPTGVKGGATASTPLDLRNPKTEKGNFGSNEEGKRRKRKGKALRYDQRKYCSEEEDEDVEDDEAIDFSNNNNKYGYQAGSERRCRVETPTDLSVCSSSLLCKYCEISFPDREFYNIHMNYHSGDTEPFLCRCGKKTLNKSEFFRHLNADPH